jgi:hypothetical protein
MNESVALAVMPIVRLAAVETDQPGTEPAITVSTKKNNFWHMRAQAVWRWHS